MKTVIVDGLKAGTAGNADSRPAPPRGGNDVAFSEDGTVRGWNAATGEPFSQPMRHRGQVWAAEFSPDGPMVVSGAEDNFAPLWDAVTGHPIAEPLANGEPVTDFYDGWARPACRLTGGRAPPASTVTS